MPGTLILCDYARGDGWLAFLAVLIYCAGLIAMLVCSAAYNTATSPRLKAILRRFDHAAIFIMIAGTYTPFTIIRLGGAWSVAMTASVWGATLLATTAKIFMPRRLERFSLLMYLALGWIGLIALKPLLAALDTETLILLGVGGLLYTLGTVFHNWRSLNYQNAIWHGFVVAAATIHYVAVLHQVIAG